MHTKKIGFFKSVILLVIFSFSLSSVSAPNALAQNAYNLPQPSSMVPMSSNFDPAVIKGIRIYPDDPFRFDFIVDAGKSMLKGKALEQESKKVIKYFLASLTIPSKDVWVNLSPYEKDRIIPESFSHTEMGRDLLGQDYLLKQLTASLMYPEGEVGEAFWEKVYQEAYRKDGMTDVTVNTFNKVWIMPETATVYENEDQAFIIQQKLKVMLQEDYLAMKKNIPKVDPSTKLSASILREIILPEIEEQVNFGEHFATLRQIYHSMILATWFKRNLKKSLLGKGYVDQGKIKGVDLADKETKDKIYQQYLKAFRVGVYNYIREEYDPSSGAVVPKKYFAGGIPLGGELARIYKGVKGEDMDPAMVSEIEKGSTFFKETVHLKFEGKDTENFLSDISDAPTIISRKEEGEEEATIGDKNLRRDPTFDDNIRLVVKRTQQGLEYRTESIPRKKGSLMKKIFKFFKDAFWFQRGKFSKEQKDEIKIMADVYTNAFFPHKTPEERTTLAERLVSNTRPYTLFTPFDNRENLRDTERRMLLKWFFRNWMDVSFIAGTVISFFSFPYYIFLTLTVALVAHLGFFSALVNQGGFVLVSSASNNVWINFSSLPHLKDTLTHEWTHWLVKKGFMLNDLPMASAIGVLFYEVLKIEDEEMITSVLFSDENFEVGRTLFKQYPNNPRLRLTKMLGKRFKHGYMSIFKSTRNGAVEEQWTYGMGAKLAGVAAGIISVTKNPRDGLRYLERIAQGEDPIEVENEILVSFQPIEEAPIEDAEEKKEKRQSSGNFFKMVESTVTDSFLKILKHTHFFSKYSIKKQFLRRMEGKYHHVPGEREYFDLLANEKDYSGKEFSSQLGLHVASLLRNQAPFEIFQWIPEDRLNNIYGDKTMLNSFSGVLMAGSITIESLEDLSKSQLPIGKLAGLILDGIGEEKYVLREVFRVITEAINKGMPPWKLKSVLEKIILNSSIEKDFKNFYPEMENTYAFKLFFSYMAQYAYHYAVRSIGVFDEKLKNNFVEELFKQSMGEDLSSDREFRDSFSSEFAEDFHLLVNNALERIFFPKNRKKFINTKVPYQQLGVNQRGLFMKSWGQVNQIFIKGEKPALEEDYRPKGAFFDLPSETIVQLQSVNGVDRKASRLAEYAAFYYDHAGDFLVRLYALRQGDFNFAQMELAAAILKNIFKQQGSPAFLPDVEETILMHVNKKHVPAFSNYDHIDILAKKITVELFEDKMDISSQDDPLEKTKMSDTILNREMRNTGKEDYAILSLEDDFKKGGIDLGSNYLDLTRQGQGVKFNAKFDEAMLADITNAEGLLPIILTITPIVNLLLELGL